METKDERKNVPSFDELVFENRNKEYGAYQNRRKYNVSMLWAIIVSVFFISATVVTPYVIYKGDPIVVKPPLDSSIVTFNPDIPFDLPKDEPQKTEVIKVKIPDLANPVVVDSVSKDEANSFRTIDDIKDNFKQDSLTTVPPDKSDNGIIPDIDNNKVVEIVDLSEKPCFGIEGDNEFRKWVAQNIHYPEVAEQTGTQGRVYIQFVIEKDGSLSNVEVLRSVDPELDKEAVRVIKASPKWRPGKQQGTAVRVHFIFPITFKINQ
jgi:periplasmic protein TonB